MISGLRILLIEDDSVFAESLEFLLGVHNFLTRVDGLSPLRKLLKSPSDLFDVVLLDKRLGDGDGISALSEIQDAYPQAAILVLTGDDDFHTINRAMGLGAADYVTKRPQLPADLLVRIPVAVARARQRREPTSEGFALPKALVEVSAESYRSAHEAWERRYLRRVLELSEGRAEVAAKRIGISRATLFKRLTLLGIERRQWTRKAQAVEKALTASAEVAGCRRPSGSFS